MKKKTLIILPIFIIFLAIGIYARQQRSSYHSQSELGRAVMSNIPTSTTLPSPVPTITASPAPISFDGTRAYADIITQTEMGPRIPNSAAHKELRNWIEKELQAAGWQVEIQRFESMGNRGYNLIASRSEALPQIILGAHYDSRIYADQDLDVDKRDQAVIGANDGASGVALLLELARKLPAQHKNPADPAIWLLFFDLEDNGRIPGWDWILGSRAFVEAYKDKIDPEAVVILDMLGDADLNIYYEKNSNAGIREEIWMQADELGYGKIFVAEERFSILDDHTPFLEAGMPAVDMIDFDYPYWHTTEDTPDKVASESLEAVGNTILAWLENKKLK